MAQSYTEISETFPCEDQDGNRYLMHKIQSYTVESYLAGGTRTMPGSFDYKTSDGQWANSNDDIHFTLKSGIKVKRVDID
ncbi:hypothetical protein RPE78_09520 [Thioclava litoralis]|uniref:Membrane-bound lysozyme-inhibitor of c-type lysozyme n=1 Tax=Thioclava litoralis TaxID=3076557 RepID=A0ABZ1DWZ4_9RHOB|nr:hypothetical protein RPE78_09520 [Thioclava sp. FTW29]